MVDIATNEPFDIVAGDRVQWKRSFTDYKAADDWALTYYLVHQTNAKITIAAFADGDDHVVDEAPATTTAWPAGQYKWQAFVTKGTDRYKVDECSIKIETNFASSSVTTFDDRAHCEKVLAAIEAVIEGRATIAQEGHTIQGRTLIRTPFEELVKFRIFYKAEVRRLKQAERMKNGLDGGAHIRVRFE